MPVHPLRFGLSVARRCLPVAAAAAALVLALPGDARSAERPAKKPAAAKADAPAAAADPIKAINKEGYWGEDANWAKHEPLLGKPAPKLALSKWINGPVAGGMKDKIVVIDFWATWCGPCLKAVPHNNEMAKKYADQGVVLVGACGGGGEETMGARAEQTKMGYPVAQVTKESTDAWAVQWWPTYAVVDRKGNLRAIGLKPDAVEKVVDALLAEQPPAKAAEKK